jgi:hypothetical protein
MQSTRDDFLARTVLAGDEDSRAGGCDLLDGVEHLLHGCGLRNDVFEGVFAGKLTFQILIFMMQLA